MKRSKKESAPAKPAPILRRPTLAAFVPAFPAPETKPESPAPAPEEKPDAAPRATARDCPLVLDGEIPASGFSPRACQTCGEFDCRFNEPVESSGLLGSRTFAADDPPEGEDDWGNPLEPSAGGDGFPEDGFDPDDD